VRALIQKVKFSLGHGLWVLNGYLGRPISLGVPHKVTVLITYYNQVRMKHINPQLRSLLKCAFVDQVIVSNHNPEVKINDLINIRDNRLSILNQNVRRSCGYRWQIAKELESEYFVVIDDDILLFPSQLKGLFECLISEPKVPHGFSGMIHMKDGNFQYRERENIDVHYLCEVYAVTKTHIARYFEMQGILAKQDESLPDAVERLGDFILISQTGTQNPKIHKVGRIIKSETFKAPGVANHKDKEFAFVLSDVSQAVDNIQPHFLA
jgi:hypothetical protein